jgi:hypothetical protein
MSDNHRITRMQENIEGHWIQVTQVRPILPVRDLPRSAFRKLR